MTDTQLLLPTEAVHEPRRPMIIADDAHVTYRVYASGKPVGARSKILGQRGGGINEVHALRGVSFTASEGESIGVVGHNGSGKSTLFRALSGLLPTSEGRVWAADRPVLLGVNAALMPELSGENNIKLGLLAMGFTAEEAASQVDEIADFAELNEFISHPMRTYSSGMGARLRFAIASSRPHSILLLDEALAVGDRRFRLKSEERIRELRDAAGLVMIVSHSAGSLKDTCERALWIHKGELRADGDAKDVVDEYTRWTKDPTSVAVGAASKPKQAPATSVAPAPAVSTSTKPVPVPPGKESARDKARRERYLANSRQKKRRTVMTLAITGATAVVAVGAGAAVALVANQADRTELAELRAVVSGSPYSTPTPTPAPTPVLPVIANFTTATTTVYCESVDSAAEAQLGWEVSGASRITLVGPPSDGNPTGTPILADLPPSSPTQAVPFTCATESQVYTLVAENAAGQQVSSAITITRELAPQEEETVPEEQTEVPVEPAQPTEPVEQPDPGTGPGTEPGTDPSTDPSTDPGTETPTPSESPDPSPSPDPVETTPAPPGPEPEPSSTV